MALRRYNRLLINRIGAARFEIQAKRDTTIVIPLLTDENGALEAADTTGMTAFAATARSLIGAAPRLGTWLLTRRSDTTYSEWLWRIADTDLSGLEWTQGQKTQVLSVDFIVSQDDENGVNQYLSISDAAGNFNFPLVVHQSTFAVPD